MEKEKALTPREHAIKYLKWVSSHCVARNTSRNNVWSNYWQLKSTGALYTNDELYDYWETITK